MVEKTTFGTFDELSFDRARASTQAAPRWPTPRTTQLTLNSDGAAACPSAAEARANWRGLLASLLADACAGPAAGPCWATSIAGPLTLACVRPRRALAQLSLAQNSYT